MTWVSYGSGSNRNYIRLDGQLRAQLVDPGANLVNDTNNVITLHYKSGLVATYTLTGDGTIRATYSQ